MNSARYEAKALKIGQEVDREYCAVIHDQGKTFNLGKDTYAMAFKALHWASSKGLKLSEVEVLNAFHSCMIVTFIQIVMLFVVGNVIFGINGIAIIMPDSVTTLALRFTCTVLMHLQVESDVRQGLRMMKFLPNHHWEFSAPGNAFFVGFMQVVTGVLTEAACILYLGSINSEIDVIIRFIALGSIAKVDDIYYNALPSENRVLGKAQMDVTVHRRHFRDPDYKKAEQTCGYYF